MVHTLERMIKSTTLISTAEGILTLAQSLRERDIIAIDTEFIRESTFFPIVEIIQVATEDQSWLVDARAFKKNYSDSKPEAFDRGLVPLLEVFQDPKILKILHAAQGDQECLYTSFGVVASPTLDTAVAASLCGYGDAIGLGKLLQAVMDIHLAKGHARTNWSVRPLPEQLMDYAHADVEHLVLLGKKLIEQLEKLGRRAWAFELSAKWENPSLYQVDVEGIAHKLARGGRLDKKGYQALLNLVQWREQRVRHLNLPRRWVADDHVLLDLAHVRPKDLEHLSAFRGLNKGELKHSGAEILEAIRRSSENPEVAVPKAERPPTPTPEEMQALELIRCYVGVLAEKHQIAAKHLMTAAKLLPVLRNKIQNTQDLIQQGILGVEAAGMIGTELIAMVQGKRAMRVRGNEVEIIHTEC
jgi:ribonuclease D